jgi:hypothetical protein
MLHPHRSDFFICSEPAPRNLGVDLGKVGFLFRRQRNRRLLDPGERQHARNPVLHLVGQGGASGDGLLFEQAGHGAILAQFS